MVLPGFGAFLCHPISARVNTLTNDFYPPQKQLSFNIQLQSNDGLLANHISEVEKISFEVANRKIEKQLAQLKSRLDKGETIEFKYIGELSTSKEGMLTFVHSDHLNYMTEAFGLSCPTMFKNLVLGHDPKAGKYQQKTTICVRLHVFSL